MTPEVIAHMSIWRQKAAAGTLSLDDMVAAIGVLRESRSAAAAASTTAKKATAKKVIPDGDDLLSDMFG
jgi:hypothetical protein